MDLKEYIYQKRMTQTEFAQMIGYHNVYVSGIIKGRMKPGKGFKFAVEKFTNGEVTFNEKENKNVV